MDFEGGHIQPSSSIVECRQCVPYPSQDDSCPQPEFCQNCGALVQRKASHGNLFEKFVSSPVFASDGWRMNPGLILTQMFANQAKINPAPTQPNFCLDRPQLTRYLEVVCRHYDLKISTFVLGLRLFDEVCTEINFKREELTLIAMQALAMAAKMEEHPNVFSFSTLIKIFVQKFSIQQITFAEQVVFKLLKFKLKRETILDFVYFFLSRGIVNANEFDNPPSYRQQQTLNNCESMALRLTIQAAKTYDAAFIEPSEVAAAVIWGSRTSHGFHDWTIELVLMTRASAIEAEHVYNQIFRNLEDSAHFSLKPTHSIQNEQISFCSDFPESIVTSDSQVEPALTQSHFDSVNSESSLGLKPAPLFTQSSFEDLQLKDSSHQQQSDSKTDPLFSHLQTSCSF
jgi:hypothetical protein